MSIANEHTDAFYFAYFEFKELVNATYITYHVLSLMTQQVGPKGMLFSAWKNYI